MKYTIEIETDNDAFLPDPNVETARILRELAQRLVDEAPAEVTLRDANGNRVGRAVVSAGALAAPVGAIINATARLITFNISREDFRGLVAEATRYSVTVAEMTRRCVRAHLGAGEPTP